MAEAPRFISNLDSHYIISKTFPYGIPSNIHPAEILSCFLRTLSNRCFFVKEYYHLVVWGKNDTKV